MQWWPLLNPLAQQMLKATSEELLAILRSRILMMASSSSICVGLASPSALHRGEQAVASEVFEPLEIIKL